MSFGYNEDLLQFIWEYQLYNATSLITTDGSVIQIIKQGYLNRSNGPDFERAEIRIANTTHYGAVEIHVDSREWEQHGCSRTPITSRTVSKRDVTLYTVRILGHSLYL